MDLVFATHNPFKVREVRLLLPPKIELLSLADIGCTDPIPETAPTLEGNAIIKTNYIYDKYGYSCFADDTGLEVEALNGQPGVYSARYAGESANAEDNIDKLLKNLKSESQRSARFVTVIALNIEGELSLFKGVIEGVITTDRRGQDGFGYDPVFLPEGFLQTFAQMPLELKNRVSHRGRALKKLIEYLGRYA